MMVPMAAAALVLWDRVATSAMISSAFAVTFIIVAVLEPVSWAAVCDTDEIHENVDQPCMNNDERMMQQQSTKTGLVTSHQCMTAESARQFVVSHNDGTCDTLVFSCDSRCCCCCTHIIIIIINHHRHHSSTTLSIKNSNQMSNSRIKSGGTSRRERHRVNYEL